METKDKNILLVVAAALLIGGYLIYVNYVKQSSVSNNTVSKNTSNLTNSTSTNTQSTITTTTTSPTSSVDNFYSPKPPCVQVTYTAIPNNSRVIAYLDCNGNPMITTLYNGSVTLSLQQGSDLYYDVPYDFTTKLSVYPVPQFVGMKLPSTISIPSDMACCCVQGGTYTIDCLKVAAKHNQKINDVLNQRWFKEQQSMGFTTNYITQPSNINNSVNIVAQIIDGINNGSVFTTQNDISLLAGSKNFQFVISAAEAGLIPQDLMGNLGTLQNQSNTISQYEVNLLNQAVQQANPDNTLSQSDQIAVCMQNAVTSLQQQYCQDNTNWDH